VEGLAQRQGRSTREEGRVGSESRMATHACLFCDLCGSMLSFTSASYASCLVCHAQRKVQEFEGTEIWCTSEPEVTKKDRNLLSCQSAVLSCRRTSFLFLFARHSNVNLH
jgi:hypothetical protein